MKLFIYTLTLILITSLTVYAQTNSIAEGMALLQQSKFTEAELKFKEAVIQDPGNKKGWFFMGISQLNQQKNNEAIESLKKSLQDEEKENGLKNETYFQIAKAYALLNDKINTLEFLKLLQNNNGKMPFIRRVEFDKAFSLIKSDSAMEVIKEGLKRNSTPCLYDPNFKKLDFFVGEWDVFVRGKGTEYNLKVGSDSVVQQPGGCSIIEYFTYFNAPSQGIPNFEGRSMSFFDHAKQKFIHSWAGSAGDIINYEEFASGENTITFLCVTNNLKDGSLMHRKFQFTYNPSDKTIHQFIQNSSNMGKTWSVDWDAIFRPKNKKPAQTNNIQ